MHRAKTGAQRAAAERNLLAVSDALPSPDGSAAGYYFAAGSGEGKNQWLVYLEGSMVRSRGEPRDAAAALLPRLPQRTHSYLKVLHERRKLPYPLSDAPLLHEQQRLGAGDEPGRHL